MWSIPPTLGIHQPIGQTRTEHVQDGCEFRRNEFQRHPKRCVHCPHRAPNLPRCCRTNAQQRPPRRTRRKQAWRASARGRRLLRTILRASGRNRTGPGSCAQSAHDSPGNAGSDAQLAHRRSAGIVVPPPGRATPRLLHGALHPPKSPQHQGTPGGSRPEVAGSRRRVCSSSLGVGHIRSRVGPEGAEFARSRPRLGQLRTSRAGVGRRRPSIPTKHGPNSNEGGAISPEIDTVLAKPVPRTCVGILPESL